MNNKEQRHESLHRILAISKFVLLVLFIVLVPLLLYIYGRNSFFSDQWFSSLPAFLNQYRKEAFLILTGLQFIQVVICFLPGEPIQIVSSYFYGIAGGYAIAMIGAITGAAVAFGIARLLGSDAMHLLFGQEKVQYYRKKLNSSRAFIITFVIYLIPGIPKDLVAYVAGVSEMRFIPFIIISTIGRTPGILGSLLMGSFLQTHNYTGLLILLACTGIILLICYKYRRIIMETIDRIEENKLKKEEEKNNGKERS